MGNILFYGGNNWRYGLTIERSTLPEGWVSTIDPTTKVLTYRDKLTNRSTTDHPICALYGQLEHLRYKTILDRLQYQLNHPKYRSHQDFPKLYNYLEGLGTGSKFAMDLQAYHLMTRQERKFYHRDRSMSKKPITTARLLETAMMECYEGLKNYPKDKFKPKKRYRSWEPIYHSMEIYDQNMTGYNDKEGKYIFEYWRKNQQEIQRIKELERSRAYYAQLELKRQQEYEERKLKWEKGKEIWLKRKEAIGNGDEILPAIEPGFEEFDFSSGGDYGWDGDCGFADCGFGDGGCDGGDGGGGDGGGGGGD